MGILFMERQILNGIQTTESYISTAGAFNTNKMSAFRSLIMYFLTQPICYFSCLNNLKSTAPTALCRQDEEQRQC